MSKWAKLRLQEIFNYNVDSDEEWIDEPGESLSGDDVSNWHFLISRQNIQEWTEWNFWKTAFKFFFGPFLNTLSHVNFFIKPSKVGALVVQKLLNWFTTKVNCLRWFVLEVHPFLLNCPSKLRTAFRAVRNLVSMIRQLDR